MKPLQGKVALVAGATRGAGRGIALDTELKGRVVASWTLAKEYGFTDADGRQPDWGAHFAAIKADLDEAVLEATERVLLERGPHAFTLAQVSKRAGIAPATLIQRFGTKQGLLRAYARAAAKRAAVREPVSDEPPLKTLMALLLKRAEKMTDRRAFANGMQLLLEDLRDEPLRASAARQAYATELVIERLLDEAGCERPEAGARVLYAAWNGALIQWALRGEGTLEKYLRRVLAEAIALLVPR